MAAQQAPTQGAIGRIFAGVSPAEFQPLLEVRNVKRLQQEAEVRYAVAVTDGDFVVKALALPGSALIAQIEAGQIFVHALVRAAEFRVEEISGQAFLLLFRAEVLGTVPEELRVPSDRLQKHMNARTGAHAESGLQTQADPSLAPAQPRSDAGSCTTPEKRGAQAGFAEQTPLPQPAPARAPAAGVNPYGGPPAACQQLGGTAGPGAAGGRSSTISDFFGRQPVVPRAPGGASANGGFLPIQEISPYTNGRWRLKARVITKSDIRRFSNARGEGQLFKIDIADKTGEISATFFGKAVDTFYNTIRQGQVYCFSRGHVRPANPRFDRGEHVLTFEEQAVIEAMEDDRELPGVTYDFRPLCSVPETPVNTLIDVQAMICMVQEPFSFTAKTSNREMVKREVGLWDPSGPEGASFVNLTMWGEKALAEDFVQGAPVFLKAARVQEWNNQKDLSSPAVYEVNPDDPRAFALKAKFEEHQKTRPLPMTMSRGAQGAAGARKSVQSCRDEDLHLGPPPLPGQGFDPNGPRTIHRHFVLGTVTNVPYDRMPCYPSCPGLVDSSRATQPGQAPEKRACQKKVTQEGPGIWRCANGHICQQPVFRYLCKMQVMDHTDHMEVNVYDNVAKQFFGVEAQEYARLYEDPEQELQLAQINRRVLWKRVLLKLRASKEVWQEAERIRYNVDDASGVVVAKEARHMLAEVKSALAAEQAS
uniref:Replication protein A 70 kDa DNA-binding subunit n=1 Tax=Lingulaulax polyedra TaxID=160621 RepID=A0A516AFU1_LINPO|nr:replication protein A 70 kDa DNA-binding subunit [Lingulodinium polyedra]